MNTIYGLNLMSYSTIGNYYKKITTLSHCSPMVDRTLLFIFNYALDSTIQSSCS